MPGAYKSFSEIKDRDEQEARPRLKEREMGNYGPYIKDLEIGNFPCLARVSSLGGSDGPELKHSG